VFNACGIPQQGQRNVTTSSISQRRAQNKPHDIEFAFLPGSKYVDQKEHVTLPEEKELINLLFQADFADDDAGSVHVFHLKQTNEMECTNGIKLGFVIVKLNIIRRFSRLLAT
jgi:hypothetical protein